MVSAKLPDVKPLPDAGQRFYLGGLGWQAVFPAQAARRGKPEARRAGIREAAAKSG